MGYSYDIGKNLNALGFAINRGVITRGIYNYATEKSGYLHSNSFSGNKEVIDISQVIGVSTVDFGEGDPAPILVLETRDGIEHEFIPLRSDIDTESKDRSLVNCVDIMYKIFPTINSHIWYDELMERARIDTVIFGEELGLMSRSDATDVLFEHTFIQKLKEYKFKVIFSKDTLLKALEYHLVHNRKNLFRDWLEGLKWDGKPRIKTMFQDVFGATAPALPKHQEDNYIGAVAQAWLLGACYRAHGRSRHEVIPCLVGAQGIGKGLALKWLAANDDWFIDTSISAKMFKEFLDSVRGRVIVELSEMTSIAGSDATVVKAFISKEVDQYRKSYARHDETFPRRFILISTTNIPDFLQDPTGNRRFYPLYCDPLKAKVYISTDRSDNTYPEQIWAEAMHYYRKKHPQFVDKRIQALAESMQDYATIDDPNVMVIENWLDQNKPALGEFVTREEIIEYALHVAEGETLKDDKAKAYRAWASFSKRWEKVPHPIKYRGLTRRGYRRIVPIEGSNLFSYESKPQQNTLLLNNPKVIEDLMNNLHDPDNNVMIDWMEE